MSEIAVPAALLGLHFPLARTTFQCSIIYDLAGMTQLMKILIRVFFSNLG